MTFFKGGKKNNLRLNRHVIKLHRKAQTKGQPLIKKSLELKGPIFTLRTTGTQLSNLTKLVVFHAELLQAAKS